MRPTKHKLMKSPMYHVLFSALAALTFAGFSSCAKVKVEPIEVKPIEINVNVRVDGTFSSETEASGTQTFSASCEGADCSNPLFVQGIKLFYPNTTLPCGYTIGFTADAK